MPLEASTKTIETTQGDIEIRALRRKEFLKIQAATLSISGDNVTAEDKARAEAAVTEALLAAVVKGAKKIDDLEVWEYFALLESIKEFSFGSREKN